MFIESAVSFSIWILVEKKRWVFPLPCLILSAAVCSWNPHSKMATAATSAKTRQRKHSFSSSISLLNRTRSMTDQTLLGVLNILRMDEGQGQSFMVKAILPDGKPRLVRLKDFIAYTKQYCSKQFLIVVFYFQNCATVIICACKSLWSFLLPHFSNVMEFIWRLIEQLGTALEYCGRISYCGMLIPKCLSSNPQYFRRCHQLFYAENKPCTPMSRISLIILWFHAEMFC